MEITSVGLDELEKKTKKELIKILRSDIFYGTTEGIILKCPLYAIYLVYKFFGH